MDNVQAITALVTLNFGAQVVVDHMELAQLATQVVVTQVMTLQEAPVLQESLQEVAVATQDKVRKMSQDQTQVARYTLAIRRKIGTTTVLEVVMVTV